jgi:opacity protein-like surface antigen
MSQCTRARGLALWLTLLLALAAPLASSAAEDEDEAAEEQAEPAAEEDEGEEADAGEETDWDVTHRGFYLIASGSYAFMVDRSELESKAEDAQNTGPANSNTDDSWGYGGRLGWRFFDRLAIEGQFQMLNSIEIHSHQDSNGDNRRAKATFMTAMANAKGYLLTERIQPYAMAGVGYGYAELRPSGNNRDDRDQGFAAQFGVGTDFYATDNLGVMTEVAYTLPTGDIDAYDNVAILFGVMLRFYGE